MLPAQVEYWKLQESRRHNIVTEAQGWGNLALGYASLGETKRHNIVWEGETQRHNVVSEALGFAQLGETHRHNVAVEGIEWGRLEETNRHNVVSEQQAERNINLGYANLGESIRSHQAQERLTSERQAYERTLGFMNYSVNESRANTERMNAETRQQELALKHEQFEHQRYYDWSNFIVDTYFNASRQKSQNLKDLGNTAKLAADMFIAFGG